MRPGAAHCTILVLLACALPGFALAQDDPLEKRGVDPLDAKKPDARLDYGRRHALVIGIDDYEDAGPPPRVPRRRNTPATRLDVLGCRPAKGIER